MAKKKPAKRTGVRNEPGAPPRGKNAGAQTNGQFQRDPKRRNGQYSGAGDAPLMLK